MIFVFDLDGTICFSGKNISPAIILELKKLELIGHQIVFASARPIRDMLPLLERDFSQNFLIGGNGSIISYKGKVEVIKSIDDKDFSTLKKIILDYDLDYLVDSNWDYALKNRNDTIANINNKIDSLNLAKNLLLSDITCCIKCNLLNIPINIYDEINKIIEDIDVMKIIHSENHSIDIVAKGINKYETLTKYIDNNQYIAFGNDNNDIELLLNSQFGVCVGNNENVQKVSDIVLQADDKDIAYFLSTYKF